MLTLCCKNKKGDKNKKWDMLETMRYNEYKKFMNLWPDSLAHWASCYGMWYLLQMVSSQHCSKNCKFLARMIVPAFNCAMCCFSEHRSLKIYHILPRS
jgi:hypothetical protein